MHRAKVCEAARKAFSPGAARSLIEQPAVVPGKAAFLASHNGASLNGLTLNMDYGNGFT